MRRLECCLAGGILVLASVATLVAPGTSFAAEEVNKFLEKLKERGYYDVALDYTEQMKDSPLAPAEFKKNILSEQGSLLIDWARRTGDSKLREQLFADAEQKLENYAANHAGTLEGAKANTLLANLLVERGKVVAAKAKAKPPGPEQEAIYEEARKFYSDARQVFEDSETVYVEKHKTYPPVIDAKAEPQRYEERNQVRSLLVQTKLFIATSIYELAKTYSPDTEEGQAKLREAADAYGDLYEKYRRWIAGQYARLYQGRCFQDMKDYKTAMSYYEDLLAQPAETPPFRVLIAKTHVQVGECLLAQQKYQELIDRSTEWLEKARGAEDKNPDFLAIRYQLAVANAELAKAIKDEAQAPNRRRILTTARNYARFVERWSPELQKDARRLLAELSGAESTSEEPETFVQAYELGDENIKAMTTKQGLLPQVKQNNPDEYDKMVAEVEQHRENAFRYLRMALGLVDENTEINQINLVRYYLCYMYWMQERFYDAAVMGEFLATRYPASAGARQAAKIAMASYMRQYQDPSNTDQQFDSQRVIDIALRIAKQWPDQSEAAEAYALLINFSIQQGKIDEAEKHLEKLPESSPNRPELEMRVGLGLWNQFKEARKLDPQDQPDAAEMDAWKERAQQWLEKSSGQLQASGQVDRTLISALLSLAEIYLDTGDAAKAIQTLEDEKVGPVTLLEANHPASQIEGFAESIYQTALRAYVTSGDRLDEAQAVMDTLEKLVASKGEAGAEERLTQIFIAMGRKLEESLKLIDDEAARQQVAQGFESFLDRIGSREQGNTWSSRLWIAQTFYNLGSGFETSQGSSAKSSEYFKKALAAYQKVLSDVGSGKLSAPSPTSLLGVKMRMAECQSKAGDYEAAIDVLAEILSERATMLEAQLAAAYAFDNRGRKEDPKWHYHARMGWDKDMNKREKVVWGWQRMAQVTAPHEKFRHIFHEASYNLALSNYEHGQQVEASKQRQYFERAKRTIATAVKLYRNMGKDGQQRLAAYDRLLKKVQKALGEEENGLQLAQN